MTSNPRKPVDLLLTVVFVLLGAFRLYQFAVGRDLADLLSGIGLLLLSFSSYHRTFLMSTRTAMAENQLPRYAGYLGLALILAAIALRLMA